MLPSSASITFIFPHQAPVLKTTYSPVLYFNPLQFSFCPPALFRHIALSKVTNGGLHLMKSRGYLSVFILVDHPCRPLSFLKSSFYFTSVTFFVFPPTALAIPLSLFQGSDLGPISHDTHLWREFVLFKASVLFLWQ